MKYGVMGRVGENWHMYQQDIFDTEEEAQTFVGIESMQMEAEKVEEFKVLHILERED